MVHLDWIPLHDRCHFVELDGGAMQEREAEPHRTRPPSTFWNYLPAPAASTIWNCC
jgi:hypothetical protein